MIKFDVLGLGESLKEYKPSGNKTIGVNDIWKHYSVDYLICIDRPSGFSKERFKTILNSKPIKFFSHLEDWKIYNPNFELMILTSPRGSLDNIEGTGICYSNNSMFVAVVMAYKLGAKEINIFGADFNTHPNFQDNKIHTTLKDFKKLFLYLKSKGIKINISKGSKLNQFSF